MKRPAYLYLMVFVVFVFISACTFSGGSPTEAPDDSSIATAVAATLTASAGEDPVPAATDSPVEPTEAPVPTDVPTATPIPGILPHSLYYLAETAGIYQVWRMETDGITTAQITNEPADVLWFDVSTADGRIAYVSNDQLLIMEADGSGRTMLVDGGPNDETDDYFWRRKVSSPQFSPDGTMLAFGQNGLNIYYFATGNYENLIENVLDETNPALTFVQELYFPSTWSPDGTKLMVDISWYEGGTMAVWNFGTNSLVELVWGGIICCDAVWAPDSGSLVAASPYLGLIQSGMWRFDAETGAGTTLLDTAHPDGTYNYAGWPLQLPDNTLRFFYHNSPTMVEGNVIMHLVQTGLDGITGLADLMPDSFDMFEALWAPDGTSVIVVQRPAGPPAWPQAGPMVLVRMDGEPTAALVAEAHNPIWGP